MPKRKSKQVVLETYIGVPDDLLDDYRAPVDDATFRRNLTRILGRRRTKSHFEEHFTMFNALSLLSDHANDPSLFDFADGMLTNYVLTCRTDSEANFMLNDLIIDHWPEERSVRLASILLERCRYQHRVQRFLHQISYMPLRPKFAEGLRRTASKLARSRNDADRYIARVISEAMRRPREQYFRLRLPALKRA